MTTPEQLPLDFEMRSAMSEADFLVTEANRDAVDWIDRWPGWPGPALCVHGPAGCGKSHLAAVFRERSQARIADTDTIATPSVDRGGAWVVDGVGSCIRDVGEESLLHFYNAVVEAGGSLLLCDREPPARWEIALPDLRSRLNAASAVEIEAPDDALLAAVLVKLLADRQLRVGVAVVEYVLARMERSFAAAGELVDKLDRLALAEKREITVPLARRVLSNDNTGEG